MQYSDFVSALQTLLAITPGDVNGQTIFAGVLPNIINDAELRCYRALQLIDTEEAATTVLSPGNRNTTLPSGMIVAETAAVTTSAGIAPDAGTAQPVRRVSRAFLDFSFPTRSIENPAAPSVPQYFARLDASNIQLGPAPDGAYQMEFVGTIRPAPLSSANPSTILTQFFPDIFLSASMVFGAGYQRDFGAQTDDPKLAITWESHFQDALHGADVEEQRRKAIGPDWTPMVAPPQGQTRDSQ